MQHTGSKSAGENDLVPGFETGRFPAHGRSTIQVKGDIVFQEHTGPFNAEFFRGLSSFRSKLHDSGDLPPVFGVVVTWHGSILMTPDALEAYRHFTRGTRGRVVAYVMAPDTEGMSVMLPTFRAIWAQLPREIELFGNREDASAWVRARLDQLNAG
jgi:hypothetical protein